MNDKIKVIVADDHKIIIDGVKALLGNEANIEVIGEAATGEEVLEILKQQKVDIAVLDIEMAGLNGIATTQQIKENFFDTKVLILSMYKQKDFILNLFKLGVNGYILKNKGREELVAAINTIHLGAPYFPLEVMQIITENPYTKKEIPNLTDRELEVLRLVAVPLSAKEISQKLHISKVTVETHIRNIKEKLELKKNGELIKYAMKNNLCD